jgi:hypothetical protein
MDDSLLLALGAHELLDLGRELAWAGEAGGVLARPCRAAAQRPNPHHELARWCEDMAQQLEGQGDPLYDYALEKIEEHNRLGTELDLSRARRADRGRGFQRLVRGVARAPLQVVRAVGVGVRETLRFAGSVVVIAAEQAPRLAREYVQRKIREVTNLLQGRIDLVWDRIADRAGWPFAVWLRARVDRAFIRHRNRLAARLKGGGQQAAGPANAATRAAAADVQGRLAAFERAGSIVATCTYYELADPARPDADLDAIPFEIRMELASETIAYRFEVQDEYEDYQKCEVSIVVEGGGVFADSDEAWYQGEESMSSVRDCTILNVETGERYGTGPTEGGWKREIAGFIDPALTTLYWCPAAQLGGINTMMQTGMQNLIASGQCQACPLLSPS